MPHSILFNKLATLKQEHAKTFLHPDNAAIFLNLKHRHQHDTHFLYELLQNANDARATEARFMLFPDGLAFCHNAVSNGGEAFTITDPDAGIDAHGRAVPGHRPGHVNAITNIGRGSKPNKQDANTIGKFGTGFKSVFVLTDTPHIYDQHFAFSIRDLIVPNLLLGPDATPHFPWSRTAYPTLFWFPFNTDSPEQVARLYHDIQEGLSILRYPLLFLPTLRSIEWEVFAVSSHTKSPRPVAHGTYLCTDALVPAPHFNGKAHLITLDQEVNGHHLTPASSYRFLTLSQPAPGRTDLSTILAFAIRPDGTLKTEETFETFCYFSTQEKHGLRFIVQAPWALGDSRELLRAGDPWNTTLIKQAAELLAESLPLFRDLPPFAAEAAIPDALPRPASLLTDEILQLLPLDTAPRDAAKPNGISFMPLHTAVTDALKVGRLLPTSTGHHVKAANAYLSESDNLLRTFAEPQLRQLTGNPEAAWIFPTLNKGKSDLVDYVLSLLPGSTGRDGRQLTAARLARLFTEAFAAAQSNDWFISFYQYLKNTSALFEHNGALRSRPFLRLEPIDPGGPPQHASPWHEDDDNPRVFLPSDSPIPGILTLHHVFVADNSLASFRQLLGLTKPDLLATLETEVIGRYQATPGIRVSDDEHLAHYRALLQCWTETAKDSLRRERLCELLEDKNFIRRHGKKGATAWCRPGKVYLPSPDLSQYFRGSTSVAIVDTDFYAPLHDEYSPAQLHQFWLGVGVADKPRVVSTYADETSPQEEAERIKRGHGAKDETIEDRHLDHLIEGLLAPTPEWSAVLYRYLVQHLQCESPLLKRLYYYFYYQPHKITTPSNIVKLLQSHSWLYDRTGQLQPTSYFKGRPSELALAYVQDSEAAKLLLRTLGIQDEREVMLSQHLSAQELEAYRIITQQLQGGRSAADILDALQAATDKVDGQPLSKPTGKFPPDAPGPPPTKPEQKPTPIATLPADYLEIRRRAYEAARLDREKLEQVRLDTLKRNGQPASDTDGEQPDTDPTTAAADRSAKAIEREQQLAIERADSIMRRAQLDAALDPVSGYAKYSFAWCQTALELESLLSGEQAESTTELNVSFAHGGFDPIDKSHRTLILRDPARYIPRNIEDRGNLELELTLSNGTTKSVLVDVASVKDFTLRVKLANAAVLTDAGIKLADVRRFNIRVQSPTFLTEELRRHFNELGRAPYNFAPDKNLRATLPAPPSIRFIFGPPGTGKTQHIADKEIRQLMREPSSQARILVLTPTNKAADVLTKRLLETTPANPSIKQAPNWLIRYGTTADPELDPIPNLVRGPLNTNLDALSCYTVITTVARFPYATYGTTVPAQLLATVPWDYIILDEASMIPLVAVLNIIYHCAGSCKEFIIGGDPKQIPPVVLAPQLAEENIYSLVELDDFETRRTIPHQYPVVPLTTQYRATPPLGELFNRFSYQGLLKHARPLTGTLPNPLNPSAPFRGRQDATFGKLTLADLTIIRFPVQPGESILQARRLQQGSQYHPYSGLLTAEIIRHVVQHLDLSPGSSAPFRIGVICPYTAQASLVREILKQMQLPVEVLDPNEHVGTIHGFQGDECDLIFALFSPPQHIPTVARRRGLPMLERSYILNVAISRAKDRLVLLVPDEKTHNYTELRQLNGLLDLAETHTATQGGNLLDYHANDIERVLFGRAGYITSNSLSSGHQIVNVYGPTERRYEIRLSDTALDVHVNLAAVSLGYYIKTN
jgi:hypothetical protein